MFYILFIVCVHGPYTACVICAFYFFVKYFNKIIFTTHGGAGIFLIMATAAW